MMSHIDLWATLATMVGLTPPPPEWVGDDGKPIYFDSIDNSAYVLGKAPHSARTSWVYIDGETFMGVRADIGGDPRSPGSTSPGSISTPPRTPGSGRSRARSIGALYNLTMDPYEKYDMIFNGAQSTRALTTRRGAIPAKTTAGRWRCSSR